MQRAPTPADAPAIAAAHAFRAALDALARPGQVRRLGCSTPPDGLSPAAAGLLMTLADPTTPVFLALGAAGPVADWLAFQTGAPVTRERAEAVLAVGPWDALIPLDAWPQGSADYPDRSATLIVEVSALDGGPALDLAGPGIVAWASFAPVLPADARRALAANAASAPLGLDFFFAAGDRIAGLPRSTRIGG